MEGGMGEGMGGGMGGGIGGGIELVVSLDIETFRHASSFGSKLAG